MDDFVFLFIVLQLQFILFSSLLTLHEVVAVAVE